MTTATLVKPSQDATPEFCHYEDTGCEVSPACLDCPLPQCKYDDLDWFHKHRSIARDWKVWETVESEGLTMEAAAERFSVTVRTVFRKIQRYRESAQDLDDATMRALAAL